MEINSVEFNEKPILIGERINPTGKKRFKAALLEKDKRDFEFQLQQVSDQYRRLLWIPQRDDPGKI